MYYTQACKGNHHQSFMPVIKKTGEGQGCIIYDMEHMQQIRTHIPNYIFAMELSPDAPWDEEEGVERKTEGEWEFKCLMDLIQLFMNAKFWGYAFLAPDAKS